MTPHNPPLERTGGSIICESWRTSRRPLNGQDVMQPARDSFRLLDLASQAEAVQALLAGWPLDEKVAWLSGRGKLSALPATALVPQQVYSFESHIGMVCVFFIDGDDLVFIGDNTTRTVPRR